MTYWFFSSSDEEANQIHNRRDTARLYGGSGAGATNDNSKAPGPPNIFLHRMTCVIPLPHNSFQLTEIYPVATRLQDFWNIFYVSDDVMSSVDKITRHYTVPCIWKKKQMLMIMVPGQRSYRSGIIYACRKGSAISTGLFFRLKRTRAYSIILLFLYLSEGW